MPPYFGHPADVGAPSCRNLHHAASRTKLLWCRLQRRGVSFLICRPRASNAGSITSGAWRNVGKVFKGCAGSFWHMSWFLSPLMSNIFTLTTVVLSRSPVSRPQHFDPSFSKNFHGCQTTDKSTHVRGHALVSRSVHRGGL